MCIKLKSVTCPRGESFRNRQIYIANFIHWTIPSLQGKAYLIAPGMSLFGIKKILEHLVLYREIIYNTVRIFMLTRDIIYCS